MRKVPFYRHDLGKVELESVEEVLAQPILTTGSVVGEFEARFAHMLGTHHALAVTSCTGAMQLALQALGIGPGDEVITTPMTFIATATAIMQAGATPVFVDVERETGNMDAARVTAAISERTKAILPVHLYGQMCDMRALRDIANHHQLRIIEDCAHCIEGERDGVRPGQLSDAACFSFFATKNMTCGEGGAIALNDNQLYQDIRLMRLHGMDKTADDRHRDGYQHWDMVRFGWKYNMSNIEAALLMPQLDRLQAKLEVRNILAARYRERLEKISWLRMPLYRPNICHAHHLFVIWSPHRDTILEKLREQGVETTVNYRAIHLTSYLSEALGYGKGDFPVAEELGETCLSLPFYPGMGLDAVDYVCSCLESITV